MLPIVVLSFMSRNNSPTPKFQDAFRPYSQLKLTDVGSCQLTSSFLKCNMARRIASLVTAFKTYFENTSIHGFQYVAETSNRLFQFFWLLNIFAAFGLLYYLGRDIILDAEANPTITNIKTVLITDTPVPAISFLAPKLYDGNRFYRRILNSVDANNPRLDMTQQQNLAAYRIVATKFNNLVNAYSGAGTSETFEMLESRGVPTLFRKYCAKLQEMLVVQGKSAQDLENLTNELETLVSKYYLATDIETLVGERIKTEDPDYQCDLSSPPYPEFANDASAAWLRIEAPVAFKKHYGITNSEKYG